MDFNEVFIFITMKIIKNLKSDHIFSCSIEAFVLVYLEISKIIYTKFFSSKRFLRKIPFTKINFFMKSDFSLKMSQLCKQINISFIVCKKNYFQYFIRLHKYFDDKINFCKRFQPFFSSFFTNISYKLNVLRNEQK